MASPKSKPTPEATAPTPNSPDDPVQPPETPPPAAAGPEPDPPAAAIPEPATPSKRDRKPLDVLSIPEDVRLLTELELAQAAVDAATTALATAKSTLDGALTALGAHLVPPTAKRGQMFQIWVGAGAGRKLFEASLVKDGKYLVRPWIG